MKSVVYVLFAIAAIAPSTAAAVDSQIMIVDNRSAPIPLSGITEEQEIGIGRQIAGHLLGAAPLVGDPELQAYINRVGRWIASQSERPDLPWRFGVVDSKSFNAYAVPGGTVLVTRALYDALTDEAELAAILGQGISTIVRRHHLAIAQKMAAMDALSRVGPNSRVPSMALGTEIFARGLDKAAVYEADQMAVVLAARAGYSPNGLIEVLEKLQIRRATSTEVDLLRSTHPTPQERLTKLHEVLNSAGATLPPGRRPALLRPEAIPAP